MELTFQTRPFSYLHCLMNEVHFQEEVSDMIVPDSYPDIDHIADCFADVILRSKECRAGSAMISGGIKAGILYVPEGDADIQCVDTYVPFTMRFENPEITDQTSLICSICVRSVEARVINSRKISFRIGIGCELSAFERAIEEIYEIVEKPQSLQVNKEQYRMMLPLELNEKTFLIHDAISFSGHPSASSIYKFRCELLPSEHRIVGDKAIFKGTLLCKLLYLTNDHKLHCIQQIFPYSQFCELTNEYDEEILNISPVITGYDIAPIYEGTPDRLDFDVHVLAQCMVRGNKEITLLKDAYAIQGEFTAKWKDFRFDSVLDQREDAHTAKAHVSGDGLEILDLDAYCDYPIETRNGDMLQIAVPVTFRMLTEMNGSLQQKTERTEIRTEFPLSEHARCHISKVPSGELHFSMTGDGADLRYGICVCTDCYIQNNMKAICGGAIDDTEQLTRKPEIIVRSVHADTPLWDLAKAYKTTEEEIMIANHLDSNHVLEDTMLLVPVF